tara:strand:- start:1368 stop:2144 length:777 start_codon:yes stop_codon:yes gene_type:complete
MAEFGIDELGNIIDESIYDDLPVEGFTDPSTRFVDMTDQEKMDYVAPLLKQNQMYNNVQYSPYRTFIDPRTGRVAVDPQTGEEVTRRSTINTVDNGNEFYYNNNLRGSYIPEGYPQGAFSDGYPITPGVSNQIRYSGNDDPRQIDEYFRRQAGLDQPGITPNMTLYAPPEANMDMRRVMGQDIVPVPPQQPYPSNVTGRPDIYGRPSVYNLEAASRMMPSDIRGRPSVYNLEQAAANAPQKQGGLLDIIANIKKSIFD